ncbi:MAG: BatA domain-containing protein [Candidatus Altiarchaeota archaeon]
MPIDLLRPDALLLLLLLLPIIILYLLKPKPKNLKFPSIMFIMHIEKSKRFSSFFKKFIRDPLLIVQIFIIMLLALSIANPFFISETSKKERASIAMIIDGAISMQSNDIKESRFEKAKELAISILNDESYDSYISIIFAERVPILLLKNSDKETAISLIKELSASDSDSDLYSAIMLANDILSSSELKPKKIYVFSDFSNVGDVKLAKSSSLNKNIDVKFVKVIGSGKNFAITNINAKRFLTKINEFYSAFTVENFNNFSEEVIAEIYIDDKLVNNKISKKIRPFSEELFYYRGECSNDQHIITVKIKNDDALALDNLAYFLLPEVKNYKILLITNSDPYLKIALESNPKFSVKVSNPPVIPNINEFDLVILGNVNKELLIQTVFTEIKNYIAKGGKLVIIASSYLVNTKDENLADILPVNVDSIVEATSTINIEKKHEILDDVSLESVLLNKYIKNREKNNTLIIAKTKNSAVIALRDYGKGKVAFIGINPLPEWSNFHIASSFPIFISQLIEFLNKEEIIQTKNLNSGEHLILPSIANLTTPSGKVLYSKEIILDEIGIYKATIESNTTRKNETIVVSLCNSEESNIFNSVGIETINDKNFNIFQERIKERNFIWQYLLSLSLLLLMIEAILYKSRGAI